MDQLSEKTKLSQSGQQTSGELQNNSHYANEIKASAQRLFSQMNPESPDDGAYFQELILEFSGEINVLDQLKKFHAWCLDQHPLRINNCRFRFRSWLANAAEYQKSKSKTQQPPALYAPRRRSNAEADAPKTSE